MLYLGRWQAKNNWMFRRLVADSHEELQQAAITFGTEVRMPPQVQWPQLILNKARAKRAEKMGITQINSLDEIKRIGLKKPKPAGGAMPAGVYVEKDDGVRRPVYHFRLVADTPQLLEQAARILGVEVQRGMVRLNKASRYDAVQFGAVELDRESLRCRSKSNPYGV